MLEVVENNCVCYILFNCAGIVVVTELCLRNT